MVLIKLCNYVTINYLMWFRIEIKQCDVQSDVTSNYYRKCRLKVVKTIYDHAQEKYEQLYIL